MKEIKEEKGRKMVKEKVREKNADAVKEVSSIGSKETEITISD